MFLVKWVLPSYRNSSLESRANLWGQSDWDFFNFLNLVRPHLPNQPTVWVVGGRDIAPREEPLCCSGEVSWCRPLVEGLPRTSAASGCSPLATTVAPIAGASRDWGVWQWSTHCAEKPPWHKSFQCSHCEQQSFIILAAGHPHCSSFGTICVDYCALFGPQ